MKTTLITRINMGYGRSTGSTAPLPPLPPPGLKMTEILQALTPLLSLPFRAATADLPDDTPIRIAVDTPTGPRRLITLADLRALWEIAEKTIPPAALDIQPGPGPSHLESLEVYIKTDPAVIVPAKYRLIVRFTGPAIYTLTLAEYTPPAAVKSALHTLADLIP